MGMCTVDDCLEEAFCKGLCQMHLKRQHRGASLGKPKQERTTPFRRLLDACLTYSDAESDEDYARARDRVRKAALAYARKLSSKGMRMGA